jgi:hypothetical protein
MISHKRSMMKNIPFVMLVLMCVNTNVFSQTLIHYWNFNNSTDQTTLLTPSTSLVSGSSASPILVGTNAIQTTSNTGQGFAAVNARNGDAALTHLRFNNPVGGSMIFAVPTKM